MSLNPKEEYTHPDFHEFRERINPDAAISQMREYLLSNFIQLQDALTGLNMQLHLIEQMDLEAPDSGEENFLRAFSLEINRARERILSADIAVIESFPEVSPRVDFFEGLNKKRRDFESLLNTLDEISNDEFLETLHARLEAVFSLLEPTVHTLNMLSEKEQFSDVWKAIALASMNLNFVSEIFEKWLQNKGISQA